jgi:predicted nuclease with TOPRIM domain
MKGFQRIIISIAIIAFAGSLLPGQANGGNLEKDADAIENKAREILKDIDAIDADIARLQGEIQRLQDLGQKATEETAKLKKQVDTLTERARILGDRYLAMIRIAKDYKAKFEASNIVSIVFISSTVVLGGVLAGIAIFGGK